MLKVELLTMTSHALAAIYAACKQCYSSENAAHIFAQAIKGIPSEQKQEEFVKNIVASGHESVIEHVSFTFAISGISRALSHQLVRHRIASYCLSGDTVLRSFKTNSRFACNKWTIKHLYEMSLDPRRKGRLKLMRLRGITEKDRRIVPVTIKSIMYTGRQVVYEVTTKAGCKIKATENHRFYTDKGWKRLKELRVGDFVFCNGVPAYKNKEFLRKMYLEENMERKKLAEMLGIADATLGKWIRRFGLQKPHSRYPNRRPGGLFRPLTVEEKRRISEGMKGENNPSYKRNREELTERGGYSEAHRLFSGRKMGCELCGRKEKLEIHHIDGNPKNNKEDNIMIVCYLCHKAIHRGQVTMTVFKDEVVSIEEVGKEDTYDIEVNEDVHNFIANGFVVHNSQQSQRYVKAKNFYYIIPPTISKDPKLKTIFKKTMRDIQKTYDMMVEKLEAAGIKGEKAHQDARFILPNACETKIVVTMNCRSLLNFFALRCCERAQWEIRALANAMLNICKKKLPAVFAEAGPKCERLGYCPEGRFSCGRKPLKNEFLAKRQ